MIYLMGSLRNARVPIVAAELRRAGHEVFDDWFAAGPEADDYWQKYEIARGHNYREALIGYSANHVFHYDVSHLQRANIAVLVAPAGRSAHLELGWFLGQGRPGYILIEGDINRYDVMYKLATDVFLSAEELIDAIKLV
jgi:hypothetical protein